ncbi:MAG: hypothetical protein CBE33_04635 [Candidatus Pelagibacter sp. TMED273]|nr:MAG: hypothetical protein CBE33_04635 [Candidatus Pelagibacter sp. TMED273]
MKKNNLLFIIPLQILGFTLLIMGLGWMLSSEPWMLDKFANEQRLNMKFEKLFEFEINKTLPGYLKQIYRFFGLWVFIIGMFIVCFSRPVFNNNYNLKLNLLVCIGILVYFGMILTYYLIPSSHFVYLGLLSIILHSISLYAFIKS